MKKIIISIIIFVLIGEVMIRFDKYFGIMESSRVVKIATDIALTPEYELLQKNFFTNNDSLNDFRVMVLGDSYIHGGGIEFKDNFSQNLKHMINSEKGNFDKAWVLDVSKPDSNNLDNNEAYFQFIDKFNPDVVVIGYNINDIDGNLEKKKDSTQINEFKEKKASGEEEKSFISKIYKVLYASEFVHYILHNMHNQLKTFGVTIPGSKFDATLKSYYNNTPNWQKSKELLSQIIKHTENNNIELIIYKFPEINLIEYPNLFKKSDDAIKSFFNNYSSVHYIDGTEKFRNQEAKDYMLSKYDGHPNEKAHKKMAMEVFELIKKTNDNYKMIVTKIK